MKLIKQSKHFDYAVFRLPEKFENLFTIEFKEKINDTILSGNKNIILDFTDNKVINSSGIGALISLYKSIKLNNGKLVIVGLNAETQKVFDITKLNNLFEIYDTLNSVK